MKNTTNNSTGDQSAVAKALNVPISPKQSFEISRHLRYKKTSFAKEFLEDVIALRKAVPFKRATRDIGHKAGMSSGRFPQKAAREFLKLVKSVEANAQNKGLNSANLTITKLLSKKSSVPFQGGRHRRGSKRAHIEIMVEERTAKANKRSKEEKTVKKVSQEDVKEVKETQKVKEKKSEIKATEIKPEVKKEEKVSEKVVEEKSEQESQSAEVLLEKAKKQNITKAPEAKLEEKKSERGADADNDEAARLFKELQKKGTLRGSPSAGERK